MTVARLRALVATVSGHPVTFLLAVNIVCAALGLVQFAYALTILKPADFAVIGVLAAIGGVVTGLIDIKLGDLTSKVYFAVRKEDRRQRAELLTASLALHISIGLVVTLCIIAAAAVMAGHLLSRPPEGWWISALAVRIGAGYPAAVLTLFLRLMGDFYAAGRLRLAIQSTVFCISIGALFSQPNLDGYFIGTMLGAAASLSIGLVFTSRHASRALGWSILRLPPPAAIRVYLASATFLASGWLMGVAKLLSRACDTLLVAALTDDTTTGLYRVARQAYDNLVGLTDAVHQFYTPTIVECATRQRWQEFSKHRGRLMIIGAAFAAGTIAMSWLVLRPLAAYDYPHYSAALPAFEVLASSLLVTLGVHGWLWPFLVATNQVRSMGLLTFAGAVAQVLSIWALASIGLLNPRSAAATVWVALALTYGPMLLLHGRRRFDVASPH